MRMNVKFCFLPETNIHEYSEYGKIVLICFIRNEGNPEMVLYALIETISEYREAFKLFDKDGNKSISRQELIIVMRSLGRNPTDKDIDAMMADADADG